MRRQAPAMKMLQDLREEMKLISVLTLAEVLIGTNPKWEPETRQILDLFRVVAVDEEIARVAGRLGRRHRRTHAGKTIDLLLAATAVVHGLVLVTTNARDFPMPELRLYPQAT
jgi:predicted nucleic acid-binding protein